ncbi:hypothetical protein L3V83_10120 [Thiotrichales bacterium 19X7-9]|nr:hypothetical protein [Thiotrichales bacterium 19X7-9]
MNLYDYCKKESLDISNLSESSLEALGSMFLENVNPTQEEINRLRSIDQGIISLEDALQKTHEKAKKLANAYKLEEHA